jgi:flavin-dependent dehydrogenase
MVDDPAEFYAGLRQQASGRGVEVHAEEVADDLHGQGGRRTGRADR